MHATEALGVRRRCLTCSAAFYDLGRTPIICPKCSADFQIVELPRSRPGAKPWRNAPGVVMPVVK